MRAYKLKWIIAAAVALILSVSVIGGEGLHTLATEDTQSSQPEETEKQGEGAKTEVKDMESYRERLSEIAKEQKELDEQIKQAQTNIDEESKIQENITRRINSLNEEINITTNYISELDTQIAAQQALVDGKQKEIDKGIKDFKGRLRAMYIAGSDSYAEILLGADDFFDMLMRTELVRRVADHDKNELDRLVALKNDYDEQKTVLEGQQAEYKEQYDALAEKKLYLDELYRKSAAAMQESQELKEKLDKQNKILNSEKSQYADKLSEFLKDDYGDTPDETQRMQTELAAIQKLRELWASQAKEQVKDKDEDKKKGECLYNFSWPCPSTKQVTSGVGPRWGTTHKGTDIGANMGSEIVASEGGRVVIASNTCTHNVPKDGSCGCGGGYGNYVVIDHGNGFITLYGHLTEATVAVGQLVNKGDKIGISGTTGYSLGPHLHFELRYGGNYMNPLSFVQY
ncbi:MAG: peptidoglycan DD-metalloendopeptidase family protein [Ruminococcus sp.]|nr:peptidoglycan DD-metalloendopeptidase family protein [Ruminococcus sp.]